MNDITYMIPGAARARRRKRGQTQGDIAAAVGVSVPTVCKWESGRTPVPWARVASLAVALGGRRGLFRIEVQP